MPNVACRKCSKQFYAKPYFIACGFAKYCSRKCQYSARKNGKIVSCKICKKKTYRPQKQLKASKSGLFFCSKVCQTIWRNHEFSGSRHANWKGGRHVEYRDILTKHRIKQQCRNCGITDKRLLCAHHLDRNRRNNTLSNLVWLCYNCHRLVHLFGLRIKKP